MMLELADHDLVTLPEESRTPALGDQVDRFGRIAHKDDLARVRRVQEPPHLFARLFVKLGRASGEAVDAAMDIGIVAPVVLAEAIDDGARLLRAGGGIEIDEIRMSGKDRKLAAHQTRIETARIGSNARHGCR